MCNVVLVEVLAVFAGLEPELAERFTLGVGADDAVKSNKASQPDTIETFGVEDGSGVADTFGHVCRS